MQSSELRGLIQGGDGFVSVIGLSYFSLHSPGGDELLSVIGLIFTFSLACHRRRCVVLLTVIGLTFPFPLACLGPDPDPVIGSC